MLWLRRTERTEITPRRSTLGLAEGRTRRRLLSKGWRKNREGNLRMAEGRTRGDLADAPMFWQRDPITPQRWQGARCLFPHFAMSRPTYGHLITPIRTCSQRRQKFQDVHWSLVMPLCVCSVMLKVLDGCLRTFSGRLFCVHFVCILFCSLVFGSRWCMYQNMQA